MFAWIYGQHGVGICLSLYDVHKVRNNETFYNGIQGCVESAVK